MLNKLSGIFNQFSEATYYYVNRYGFYARAITEQNLLVHGGPLIQFNCT